MCDFVVGYRQVLLLCGRTEEQLSNELVKLEVDTEEKVLKPLTTIVEDDIPLIEKLRRQLDSKTLDMDAAKTRSVSRYAGVCSLYSRRCSRRHEYGDYAD